MIRAALGDLVKLRSLTTEAAEPLFEAIMTGQAEPAAVGAMLALMQARGVTVDELVAGARAMRRHLVPVEAPVGLRVMDTCGTGGTGSRLFNVSTSAAIVAAAAGRRHGLAVAKHGNRAVTSASGSSDVLQALGLELPMPADALPKALDEAGICFCFAPAHHPGMKHAGPVRAALGIRTIFNLLGPLTNPAGARHQLLGVGDEATQLLMVEALRKLGSEKAWVITTELPDGSRLGELTAFAPIKVSQLADGEVTELVIDPRDHGLAGDNLDTVKVNNPDESAARIKQVFDGEKGSARNTVVLNAGAALVIGEAAESLEQGLVMAQEAIDSGAARLTLAKLAELSRSTG
ncbi:anthranilate phosphoribosyltransferase [Mucisphaera sp.]|uniref:anthranilate phosphoribosyltransferase n=1 Tax=Mucisphaera sp. TaxID=2913024 RepID=UPI003D12831B